MEEERAWRLLDLLGPDDFDPGLADRISRIILRTGSSEETLRELMARTNMSMLIAIYGPVWAKEIGDSLVLHGAKFIGTLEVIRRDGEGVRIGDQWEQWIVFPDPSFAHDYAVRNVIEMLRSEWGDDVPRQYIEIDETEATLDTDEWAGQDVAELSDDEAIDHAGLDEELSSLRRRLSDATALGNSDDVLEISNDITEMIADARGIIREDEGNRMMNEVTNDPIEFVRDRGYTDFTPSWIFIDYEQAADDWMELNGFHSGEVFYLPSGAVAFLAE